MLRPALRFATVTPTHLEAVLQDTLTVSTDPDAPTYLNNLLITSNTSPDLVLLTAVDGNVWIKNIGTRTFSLRGDSMWQVQQGVGGVAQFILWSERSVDDGVTVTENPFSLREKSILNNGKSSWAVPSGVVNWLPQECIRWAMYNSGNGELILAPPSEVVNGGNTIDGVTLYWTLDEV